MRQSKLASKDTLCCLKQCGVQLPFIDEEIKGGHIPLQQQQPCFAQLPFLSGALRALLSTLSEWSALQHDTSPSINYQHCQGSFETKTVWRLQRAHQC